MLRSNPLFKPSTPALVPILLTCASCGLKPPSTLATTAQVGADAEKSSPKTAGDAQLEGLQPVALAKGVADGENHALVQHHLTNYRQMELTGFESVSAKGIRLARVRLVIWEPQRGPAPDIKTPVPYGDVRVRGMSITKTSYAAVGRVGTSVDLRVAADEREDAPDVHIILWYLDRPSGAGADSPIKAIRGVTVRDAAGKVVDSFSVPPSEDAQLARNYTPYITFFPFLSKEARRARPFQTRYGGQLGPEIKAEDGIPDVLNGPSIR